MGEFMIIEKMKMKNFKKFKGEKEIYFNNDFNIIIGNNESGKSSILLGLDLVLSGSQNKVDNLGLDNIFNSEIIDEFMNGERDINKIPELYIELYLKETLIPELSGTNNSEKRECDGISLRICLDEDFLKVVNDSLKNDNAVFPFEYYKCIFKKFSDESYNSYKRPIKHMVIDESNLSNDYYVKEYISNLYSAYADESAKNMLNNQFRKLKQEFGDNNLAELNQKIPDVNFGLTNHNKYSLENNLTIYEQGISIWNKGSGSICMLKIKTSIDKKSENIDLILVEEPENHLSDVNMKKMITDIMESKKKQTFITTHNSMVCSRLDLRKIIALSKNSISTTEFNNIPEETANFFAKCPSNTILNFILSDKVILVEGAAEYILLEKFYRIITDNIPETDNVNIISVNGLSFKRYLEVAKELRKKVAVITDNDGDYNYNIIDNYKDYDELDDIKIFSDNDNNRYTFEICLYEDNKDYLLKNKITNVRDIKKFMLNNKSESAFRILEQLEINNDQFNIPSYIKDAIEWIKN